MDSTIHEEDVIYTRSFPSGSPNRYNMASQVEVLYNKICVGMITLEHNDQEYTYKQSNYLLIKSYILHTNPLCNESQSLTTYCYYNMLLLNCSNWRWIVSYINTYLTNSVTVGMVYF